MKKESKTEDKTSKKGRPKKIDATEQKKNQESSKKVVSKSKKETAKVKEEPSVLNEIKKEDAVDSNLIAIYGNEPSKNIVAFKDSDLQLQIKNTINQYGIKAELLPQELVDLVNGVASDFNYFVENRNEVGMISVIMDKDLVATNALKGWLSQENRGEILLSIKPAEKKDNQPQQENTNVVITADNINTISVPKNDTPANTGIQNLKVHDTNPLIPRTPESTYKHNVNSNNQPINHLGNVPQGSTENKDIHYQILNKANPYEDAYKQQKHMMQPQGAVNSVPEIDKKNLLAKYTETVSDAVKNTFQNNLWGYVPLDVVQGILNNSIKMYSYEIIRNGDEACVSVSDGEHKFFTDTFIIK